jgi:parallel beta-helix repeat protein
MSHAGLKKIISIIVITWILSLVTTIAIVFVALPTIPIKTDQISSNVVTTNNLADSAVITTKLSDGSVTSAKIMDGTITFVDLADGSIVTLKIADGAVTADKIADNAVGTSQLADNSITSAKVKDGTLTAEDLADGSIVAVKIADGTVTTTKISDGAIDTSKIADSAVISAKLSEGAVLTVDIADGAVTTIKIADGSVTTEKLADNSVTNAKLTNDSVTFDKIVYGTLTTQKGFIIWKDDSTYYAKNASTGAILYFGQNATTVINDALSNLSFGGTIFLCDGTYDIDGTISIANKLNVNIIGESWETKLNLLENSSKNMMEITNSNYTAVKDIYFEGNRDSQTSGSGLVVFNSGRVVVDHCLFYDIKQTALYFYGDQSVGNIQPWISNCWIEKIGSSTSDYGIWISDYASDAHIINNDVGNVTGSAIYVTSSGCLIETNTLWFSMYGLNIYHATSGEITGNIADNNQYDGINLDTCRNVVVTANTAKLNSYNPINASSGIYLYNSTDIVVSGNRAGSTGDYQNETQRYGIKEYGALSDYNTIVGNDALGNLDATKDIYTSGANTIVLSNQGRL